MRGTRRRGSCRPLTVISRQHLTSTWGGFHPTRAAAVYRASTIQTKAASAILVLRSHLRESARRHASSTCASTISQTASTQTKYATRRSAPESMSRDYNVYCLVSVHDSARTYVGCTNNLKRRLRQHNGEIVGGARFTRAHRPWKHAWIVSGLQRRDALQLEWAVKHKRSAGAGLKGRVKTLQRLLTLERWCKKARPVAELRATLRVRYLVPVAVTKKKKK